MFSSSSSIWSPDLAAVPPLRIMAPVTEARPTLSAGSKRLPVRIERGAADQGQFVVFEQIHLHAVGQGGLLDLGSWICLQRRKLQILPGRRGTGAAARRPRCLRPRRRAAGQAGDRDEVSSSLHLLRRRPGSRSGRRSGFRASKYCARHALHVVGGHFVDVVE